MLKKHIVLVLLVIIFSSMFIYYFSKVPELNNAKINLLDKILQDPNEFVLRYVQIPLDYSYGSNSIPLVISALITNGNLVELGMGSFSTPLLHKISSDYNRQLVSIDTNQDWINRFIIYNTTKNHRLYFYHDFNNFQQKFDTKFSKLGLVLVDHIYAGLRPIHAKYFANNTEIVIVHDAEKRSDTFYLYEKNNNIRAFFKYACKFSLYQNFEKTSYISTLILSNFIDLTILERIFKSVKSDFGHVACDLSF
ncbi:unnamed protein product [Brachionus calyciflorus]|uniref:Class I SAM-dependent methyltransferase n=1 Tax=Brachionus calyciflorus TaxID=104777 RepID=A0A814FJG4_9BILA|nr:unnamed protein product [Brachionus calyciflorus]